MNADELLRHCERVADAPEAAARLRRFVLDLAVRGRLVQAELTDESADVLLEQLQLERDRRIAVGEFRQPSSVAPIERAELPFSVPSHWRWARLIDVAQPSYGFAFASGQFNSSKRGMPLIRIPDISGTDTEAYFDGSFDPAYLVNAGDYLVSMDGDFNLRRWRGKPGLLNQRVLRINDWRCDVSSEFVKLPLQFILDHLHGHTSQTTVKHLSAKQVNGIEIPLPPLAEQHRIVAKVDELMAVCDRLEAARAEREAARDRLTAASLARLGRPDAESFREDARFVLDTLPSLVARPEQVKQLRQMILSLAVTGKLVDQVAGDEPAEQLVRRIRAGKSSTEAKVPSTSTVSHLPASWVVVELSQIADVGTGLTPSRSRPDYFEPPAIPWVTSGETGAPFIAATAQHVSPTALRETSLRLYPAGTLLVAMYGQGKTRGQVTELLIDATTNQACAAIVLRLPEPAHRRYIKLYFEKMYDEIRELSAGGAQPNLNVGKIKSTAIPLPPLAEQARIVARVGELMTLCDQLEAALASAGEHRRRLLEVAIHETLNGDEVEEVA
jgi:type I restriction enzyme S subunit